MRSWIRSSIRVGRDLAPLAALPLAIAALATFSKLVVYIPNTPAVLLLAVAFTAFRGGVVLGLIAAAMHVVYAALFFSESGQLFVYSGPDLVRTIDFIVVAPTMAGMMGLLRHSSNELLKRLRASQSALQRLNNELEQRVEERTAALAVEAAKRSEAEARLFEGQKLQAIGQLAGGVAHDLNNTLSVVVGSLEMLLEQSPDAPEHRRILLARSIEAAERGADLTRALLAFARKQTLRPQIVNVNALIGGIVTLLRRTLGEPIDVVLDLDPALAPCIIDRTQLENAILNLAINARDAMASGGRLTIATANARLAEIAEKDGEEALNGDYVVIEVADTGIGMAPDVLTRAFEPFFTTKEVGKGTGLGLSIVYGFARQSGGQARITSVPGSGTVVRLYLPRASAEAASDQVPARHIELRRGAGEVILTVEDNPALAIVTAEMLTSLGYRPVTAPDARSALAELERTKDIALLLTDVVLPHGMDGIALAGVVRELRPDLPVIFVSGFIEHPPRPDSPPLPAPLIPKPVRSSQLADAIAAALYHTRHAAESAQTPHPTSELGERKIVGKAGNEASKNNIA
jgi:signal transduction histidine kinase/FixJ family two-component response regulator